jgi:hypothetical protein
VHLHIQQPLRRYQLHHFRPQVHFCSYQELISRQAHLVRPQMHFCRHQRLSSHQVTYLGLGCISTEPATKQPPGAPPQASGALLKTPVSQQPPGTSPKASQVHFFRHQCLSSQQAHRLKPQVNSAGTSLSAALLYN